MSIQWKSPEVLSFAFQHSLSVFFPAFNDAPSLPSLLARTFELLRRYVADYEVIVVNDGSTDGTGKVLEHLAQEYAPHLRIVTHSENQGYGGALRSGFEHATKDFVFYTDGDGQYDPAELAKLLREVRAETGLVNGYKRARQDPWHRIAIGWLYNRFARFLFRIRLSDIDCDFRLVRRSLVEKAALSSTSGTICVELVRKIEMQTREVVEVPVDHYPRLHGRSQFFRLKSLATTFAQLWLLYWRLVLCPFLFREGFFRWDEPRRPDGYRPPGRWEWSAMVGVMGLLLLSLVSLAWKTGVTVDEPSHLVSAYLYWQGEDQLSPGDMPPLIKIVAGWVPHLAGMELPPREHPSWRAKNEWLVALEMMQRMAGEDIERIFFWSRAPLLLFPALSMGLVWWWGRQLFSPRVGVLLALLGSLSPNILGHGCLFKNDLAAAFGYLFFWYRAWVYWRGPSVVSGAWLGAAVLLGILAKLSLLILAPIAALIWCLRSATSRDMAWRLRGASLCAVVLIPFAGVLAFFPGSFGSPVQITQDLPQAIQLLKWLWLPEGLWRGIISLVQSNTGGTGVYLLREMHNYGHPLYFLVALAVKIPVALQLLIVSGLVLLGLRLAKGRVVAADLLWLLPGPLYIAICSTTSFQLGIRLILPAIMFLLLMAGAGAHWLLQERRRQLILAVLVIWMVGRVGSRYPHYLSYFNSWAGGPDHGLAYLSDSNLDWGQNVRELARFVEANNVPKIRLAYFGMDNPFGYLDEKRIEAVAAPWDDQLARGLRLKPEPGYWAISATLLTGQLFREKYRDYFAEFRETPPVAKAGYSIYIYRFD